EIEARARDATPGPWCEQALYVGLEHLRKGCDWYACDEHAGGVPGGRDAQFIAAARTDIPDLVAEVRRLRGLLLTALRRRGPGEADRVRERTPEVTTEQVQDPRPKLWRNGRWEPVDDLGAAIRA